MDNVVAFDLDISKSYECASMTSGDNVTYLYVTIKSEAVPKRKSPAVIKLGHSDITYMYVMDFYDWLPIRKIIGTHEFQASYQEFEVIDS